MLPRTSGRFRVSMPSQRLPGLPLGLVRQMLAESRRRRFAGWAAELSFGLLMALLAWGFTLLLLKHQGWMPPTQLTRLLLQWQQVLPLEVNPEAPEAVGPTLATFWIWLSLGAAFGATFNAMKTTLRLVAWVQQIPVAHQRMGWSRFFTTGLLGLGALMVLALVLALTAGLPAWPWGGAISSWWGWSGSLGIIVRWLVAGALLTLAGVGVLRLGLRYWQPGRTVMPGALLTGGISVASLAGFAVCRAVATQFGDSLGGVFLCLGVGAAVYASSLSLLVGAQLNSLLQRHREHLMSLMGRLGSPPAPPSFESFKINRRTERY